MLMFEDMLKIYSGAAAIFSKLSLQKRYFHKFSYFSDRVYFQLPPCYHRNNRKKCTSTPLFVQIG